MSGESVKLVRGGSLVPVRVRVMPRSGLGFVGVQG